MARSPLNGIIMRGGTSASGSITSAAAQSDDGGWGAGNLVNAGLTSAGDGAKRPPAYPGAGLLSMLMARGKSMAARPRKSFKDRVDGLRSLSSLSPDAPSEEGGTLDEALALFKRAMNSDTGIVEGAPPAVKKTQGLVVEATNSASSATLVTAAAAGGEELLSHIKRGYESKVAGMLEKQRELKETQERLRKLRADLAAEEQREQQLKLSLTDTLRAPSHKMKPPEKKTMQAPSSQEVISAQEYVMISADDKSEILSTIDDAPTVNGDMGTEDGTILDNELEEYKQASAVDEQEGNAHRYQFSFTEPAEKTVDQYLNKLLDGSEVGSIISNAKTARSSYDRDDYASKKSTESLLLDILRYKNSVQGGFMLMCEFRSSDLCVLGCF